MRKEEFYREAISGFGQFGPYSHRPGYDPVGQAMGGIMHVTGYPDGPPTHTGNAMADNATSLLGQYNDHVYGEILGYSPERRAQLREAGVI